MKIADEDMITTGEIDESWPESNTIGVSSYVRVGLVDASWRIQYTVGASKNVSRPLAADEQHVTLVQYILKI
jgi:hypothetical protein